MQVLVFIFNLHRNSKTMLKKQETKKKHNKIIVIARKKLNSIESKISEALINNEVSHKDYKAIINEERDYKELKESIRMMISQRSDTSLIERGKKTGIDEMFKRN